MTDPARLVEGKVAIITGAGRGLGREHALLLAEHAAPDIKPAARAEPAAAIDLSAVVKDR